MAIPPLPLLVLLLVLLGPMTTVPSSSSPSFPQCSFEYTGMALLSCQDSPPQSPTRSCCDALLFAVDTWPLSDPYKGACCLCAYVEARSANFDLAGAYVACGGMDAPAVRAWQATAALNCTPGRPASSPRPCRLDASPPPPPPPTPTSAGGGGGGGGGRRRRRKQQGPGLGVIVAIVLGALAALALLGWCIYRNFFSAAAKERTSPDPSNWSSASDDRQPDGGRGLQMSRMSSARRSTTTLLD